MLRLTSSELEIDSLMAVPSSRKSCFILSFTCPSRLHANHLNSTAYALTCNDSLWQTALPRSIFRSAATRSTLLAAFFERLQGVGHTPPQLRPVSEVLPASPLCVVAEHRALGDVAAAVVALAHEAPELGVDGDEVVAAVHGQQMRGAVRADAGELFVVREELGRWQVRRRRRESARMAGALHNVFGPIPQPTLLLQLGGGEARDVGRLRECRRPRLRAAAALLHEQLAHPHLLLPHRVRRQDDLDHVFE